MQIFTNHIGYEKTGSKHAVLMTQDKSFHDKIVYLVSVMDNKHIAELLLGQPTKVAK